MYGQKCFWLLLLLLFAIPGQFGDRQIPTSIASAPATAQPIRQTTAKSIHAQKDREEEMEAGPGGEDYLYQIRKFPHDRIPLHARARAYEQALRLRAPREFLAGRRAVLQPDSSQQWTLVGPQPTQGGDAGRVTALAIDPRDNNTVYLGGAEGGIWKTTDGGANWKPLTDFEPVLTIGSLAIDPSNPDTVYAGTGEENFNIDGYSGMGILKSTDAGATWTLLGTNFFEQRHVGSITVDPSNSNVVLAGAPSGIFRSSDGGQSWKRVMDDWCTSLIFETTSGGAAYAGLVSISNPNGIYKSVDGGQTWKSINGSGSTAIQFPAGVYRITLAEAPSSSSTLFAGLFAFPASPTAPTPLNSFYKSTDGGNTWHKLASPAYCANQCFYNNVLTVSPTDPNLMIGGGVELVASTDGGNTWPADVGQNIHVDQHAVAFTQDGSTVYIGNDGGVWVSAVAGGKLTWVNRNATLALTQFYPGVSIKPGDPTISFGGTQDNNALGLIAGKWRSIGCGDGAATAVDPMNPQNVFITCAGLPLGQGVVQRSTAGGGAGTYIHIDTGINVAEGVPFVPYLAMDPTHPTNLYITGNQHIYQTTNSGTLWTAISPDVTAGVLWPCAIAVAPSDSNTVYSGSCDGVAMVTHNALSGKSSTWQNISSGLPGTAITHITVDPSSANKAYATLSGFQAGHVFVTTDGGQTWNDMSSNLPDISANDLVIDPDLPNTLYVATDMGVFWTNTSGQNGQFWSAIGEGLPQAAVLSLAFEHTTRTLRAATHGRSVWDLLVPLQGLSLIPAISSVAPAQLSVNAASLALTVNGTNLTSSSMVLWNGQARSTSFVSSTEVTANLEASDVNADGLGIVTVFTPGPGGGVSPPYYIKIGPDPAIFPQAFLNAASYKAGNGVAPGSIISVFGVNLASGTSLANKVPLPANLQGTSISVSDPMQGFTGSTSLFFTSAAQMNVQIPWETQPNDTATFTPVLNGVKGMPLNIGIEAFAPGIFTTTQTGTGQGSIINAVTGQLAAPAGKYPNASPVKRGDYLSIYCTGLGQVDHTPADGAATPSSPLAKTMVQPVVLIGPAQGTVTFSGLAPGYVGLYQVNVQVPDGAPTGDAVPLSISDGQGSVSNIVTVAIQ